MIKIKRGDIVLTVTAGAYNTYYKHLGYEPVGVAKSSENTDQDSTHPRDDSQQLEDSTQQLEDEDDSNDGEEEDFTEEEEDPDEEVDLSEIPLGEMDLDQLHAYAEELGLEHKEITSKKKLRALIRDCLN